MKVAPYLIAAIATVALVLAASSSVIAQPTGFYADAGLAFRASQALASATVAIVDGVAVTDQELSFAVKLAALNNGVSPHQVATDRASVLETLLRTAALEAEATRRGLRPTAAGVSAYVAQMRTQSSKTPGADKEIAAFASSAGLTVDEYFASAFAVRGAQRALAVQALRDQVARAGGSSVEWEAFVTRTRAASNVIFVNSR